MIISYLYFAKPRTIAHLMTGGKLKHVQALSKRQLMSFKHCSLPDTGSRGATFNKLTELAGRYRRVDSFTPTVRVVSGQLSSLRSSLL